MLVDASGSMDKTREATIEGINKFIESQKVVNTLAPDRNLCFEDDLSDHSAPHKCTITLCTFSGDGGTGVGTNGETEDAYSYTKINDAQDINTVVPLTLAQYPCYGGTPLIDAYYRTITECSGFINRLAEDDRPGRVIIISNTDGEERNSKTYTRKQLKELIEEKTKLNWQFIYLGANQEAFSESATYGVQAGQALNYQQTPQGIAIGYSYLAANVMDKRLCDTNVMMSCAIGGYDDSKFGNSAGYATSTTAGLSIGSSKTVKDIIELMEDTYPNKTYTTAS